MSASVIASQLYTVRACTKTPADVATTLARVKKLGYDAVQLSGLGPIDPNELARMLQGEGLTCCATHTPLERLRDEPQRVADEHRLWNCGYTAVGGFIKKDHSYTPQDWPDFAAAYNAVARAFDGSSVSLGYHHHSHELARFAGRTALDLLFEKLDRSVWVEIDTYWIAHGGGDPAEWLRKAAARGGVPVVHLKDLAVRPDRTQFMAEVGEGNLNWPAVLRACADAGVEWYVVEQDTCPGDPFDSLATSLRNLRAMGLK